VAPVALVALVVVWLAPTDDSRRMQGPYQYRHRTWTDPSQAAIGVLEQTCHDACGGGASAEGHKKTLVATVWNAGPAHSESGDGGGDGFDRNDAKEPPDVSLTR
jgi:hypothetical protein